jgi:glycosyltransferase involved in cell wall biosynthesis
MRFLIIDMEIIERGGINRIVEGLKYGLEELGSQVDYYWASPRGRVRNLSPTIARTIGKRYYRLPAKQLAYRGSRAKKEYKHLLKKYDVVLFMLPCPHDIKMNRGDMSWIMLYEKAKQAGKKIIVVIHDNLWDKYYPWYRQVSDLVDFHLFTCYQSKYDSLSRLPGTFMFLPTPLDVSKAGTYMDKKIGAVCWMPQWKRWKGIYHFIRALPKIQYPVNLYNAGIEYHNIKKHRKMEWRKAIGIDHVEHEKGKGDKKHQYHGILLPNMIPGVYKMHDASVDLSGSMGKRFDGQTSCVMFESMLYGSVPVLHERVMNHKYSPLRGQEVAYKVNQNNIAVAINDLMKYPKLRQQIASNAVDFVVDYADATKSARKILELLGRGTVRTTPPTFIDNICSEAIPVYDRDVYEKKDYISEYGVKEEEEEKVDTLVQVPQLPIVSESNKVERLITELAKAWLKIYG